jgi:hypothetical protein
MSVINKAALEASAWGRAAAVTKSDVTVLEPTVGGLWVGGAGAVTVKMLDGSTQTFSAVPAGTRLPVVCTQVLNATVATLIVALY